MTEVPNVELLERLANGPRAERFKARVDGVEVELRVVKKVFARTPEHFIAQTKTLMGVDHPSLRMIRDVICLEDGRPAVVLSLVDWVTLGASARQPAAEVLAMAIELGEALGVLHEAGLTLGVLDGDDLFPGDPVVLDASLCGLSQSGDVPEADVQMLARALLGSIGGGKEAGPLEGLLRRVGNARIGARAFADEVRSLKGRLEVQETRRIEKPAETIEVLEPDLSGVTLDHWKLEKAVGEGAMARVYLATDVRDGSAAAVKVLKQEHLAEPEFIQRFIQEVRAAQTLDHAHVVRMMDFGDVTLGPGRRCVFCVMEVLQGIALSDALNRQGFGVVRAARLVQMAAEGLDVAHRAGIVHRDVKPENLFILDAKGPEQLKVLDFGVAKLLKPFDDIKKVSTRAGVVLGTPEYMAPEQALGWPTDARADIWALGLVLYELLTGELPFKGPNFGALVVAMTQGATPPLPAMTRMGERMPPGLNAVVQRCLEKAPEDRYASAAELARALEPFANPRWSSGKLPAVEAPTQEDDLTPVDEEALARAVKPSRVPLLVGLGVLVAMLGAAVFFFMKS